MQEAVRKGGVKQVSGAGGIHNSHPVGWSIPEALAVPSQSAIHAQSRTEGAETILGLKVRQGLEKILLAGGVSGKFLRGHGVVHKRQEALQRGCHVIKVCDHGDA